MLTQALDFRDECDALYELLRHAPGSAWSRPTQFKNWTFDDIVGHLHIFDYAAGLSARDRESLAAFFAGMRATRERERISLTEYTRRWLDGASGPALLARWREGYVALASQFHGLDPALRVAWGGPDMSARSLISARQMETWAHGQAAFDALGVERAEHDRLRNIAQMGVNTFAWSFSVNKRAVPPIKPYVRLTAPSGVVWEWNEPSAERIEGAAVDFCRVVAQTRSIADTALRVEGAIAKEWMAIAQCFAGPPETPPAPGTRFMQVTA